MQGLALEFLSGYSWEASRVCAVAPRPEIRRAQQQRGPFHGSEFAKVGSIFSHRADPVPPNPPMLLPFASNLDGDRQCATASLGAYHETAALHGQGPAVASSVFYPNPRFAA